MLQPVEQGTDIGVLVGRFQVDRLHKGHHSLFEAVLARHQKVVLLLGMTPGVLVTRKDPLDFAARRLMIHEAYPNIDILPLPDRACDDLWSSTLDAKVHEISENQTVTLYGSRDSFLPHYKGRYKTVELAESFQASGTEIRKAASNTVKSDPAFRQGVIYAAHQQFPRTFACVDVACINETDEGSRVLLGRKAADPKGQWRFFGGFFDPRVDKSLEDAAIRELKEEAGGISHHGVPEYLGSHIIDDWRYRDVPDVVLTSMYLVRYFHGGAEASDDMDEVLWFEVDQLNDDLFVPEHRVLFSYLNTYLQGRK